MTASKDLVVLTACSNAQFAIRGVLSRHRSLGIRPVVADYVVHPNRDPGCANGAAELLRAQTRRYSNALVLFDLEGCGREDEGRVSLENDVRQKLAASGWGGRADVVVLDPELEIWVWSNSPQVDRILGWGARIPSLRAWLVEQRFLDQGESKPPRPKDALESALEYVEMRRSSSLYQELAQQVSLERCVDVSFLRLKEILKSWFPSEAN